jgi:hypothetical protein
VGSARRRGTPRSPELLDGVRGVYRVFVFPNMHHDPAHHDELLILLPVSGDVPLEFLLPPLAVVSRDNAMIRTGVPEAAIDENRNSRGGKREIRMTGKPRKIYSEAKTTTMQFTANQHFRASRRATHSLHLHRNSAVQGCGSLSTHMTSLVAAHSHVRPIVKLQLPCTLNRTSA